VYFTANDQELKFRDGIKLEFPTPVNHSDPQRGTIIIGVKLIFYVMFMVCYYWYICVYEYHWVLQFNQNNIKYRHVLDE
jgi:hypothetical protein